MATFVLVDNVELRILKGAKSIKQLECWADLVCKKNDFLILSTETKKQWSVYGIGELAMLYAKTKGKSIPPGDYNSALRDVVAIAREEAEDPATFEQLVKRLGGKEPEVDPRPVKRADAYNPELDPKAAQARAALAQANATRAPKPARSVSPQGEVKRPGGAVTGRVWDIADTVAGKGVVGKALREEIVATCVAEGIDPSTAATQYSRWNRARAAT